jgi:cobalamin biosynthetic protein CobC
MHDASPPRPLAFAEHGGNLAAARRLFPAAPEPWLDLSTGISPYPFPFAILPAEAFTRLPDPEAIAGLETRAAEFYGACDSAGVVAAPGSQAVIQWLPQLLRARRVGIFGFAYGEYARAFAAAGAEVSIHADLAALAAMDVAVVVNPNNPDGRHVSVAELLRLASRLEERKGVLVVDEAFADFLPKAASLVPQLPAEGAIVLRSFGKSFGLAGLRLGFAIASAPLAAALRRALGPWAVSGAAIAIGQSAFADHAWLERTAQNLAADAAALDFLLEKAGMAVLGGTSLFRLARHARAEKIFRTLAEAGILVRPFAGRPDWLRFGIPCRDADRARLAAALAGKHTPNFYRF